MARDGHDKANVMNAGAPTREVEQMSTRTSKHIRSNVLGLVAIFIALGGTAYATHPGGEKTISSVDIIDDEVFSEDVANDTLAGGGLAAADLQPNSVGTSEVALDSLTGLDLATNSVTSSELASSSVGTSEVATNSLTGSDIATDSLTSSDIGTGAVGTAEHAASIPAARIRTSSQSVPHNTVTALSFGSEFYDTANVHSATPHPSRLTAPVAGIYEVTADLFWDTNSAGFRTVDVRLQGTQFLAIERINAGSAGGVVRQNVSTVARFGAGQYAEVRVQQTSGSTRTVTGDATMTWLAPG